VKDVLFHTILSVELLHDSLVLFFWWSCFDSFLRLSLSLFFNSVTPERVSIVSSPQNHYRLLFLLIIIMKRKAEDGIFHSA